MTETLSPNDFMEDAKGRLVPKSLVADIDQSRSDLVVEIVVSAKKLQASLIEFKARAMGDVQAFIDLSAEKYGATIGGTKGNVTLTSFDGKTKVQISIAEHLVFDERLQAAKALVDECLTAWTEGSRDEIKAIVNHAFQVDKEGNLNIGRILGLRRLKIKDEKWLRAMEAISDATQVVGSKSYLRMYERVHPDLRWSAVALDLAAI